MVIGLFVLSLFIYRFQSLDRFGLGLFIFEISSSLSDFPGRGSEKKFGQNWIRTSVGFRQQIYSLPPLATRTSAHKPMMGFEPATYGLQNRCSTIELHRHEDARNNA